MSGFDRCKRCNGHTDGVVFNSVFDSKAICMACRNKEREHKDYEQAQEMKEKMRKKGIDNYEGIGWRE